MMTDPAPPVTTTAIPGPAVLTSGLRLLDVCCCAGGAAMGYHRAGFEVVGVDKDPQPNYPFTFHRADALDVLADPGFLADFDAIHVSPPCQSETALTKGTNKGRTYPRLIAPVRALLETHRTRTGTPYVIENVMGAALRRDVTLCGEMFGLAVIRHRGFELGGWTMPQPPHPKHRGRVAGMRHGRWYTGPYYAVYGQGGGKGTVAQWQQAMGITWTTVRKEIAEAIPPAYTHHIGQALAAVLTGAAQGEAA